MLSFCPVAVADAQNSRRPDLGIFGHLLRDPTHSLTAEGNLGATFYEILDRQAPVSPDFPSRGWGALGTASLNYSFRLSGAFVNATVGAAAVYYPRSPVHFRVNFLPSAGIGTSQSWNVSERTQFTASAQLSYHPLFSDLFGQTAFSQAGFNQGGFGGPVDAAMFLPRDYGTLQGHHLQMDTFLDVSHELSRRWSVTVDYGYMRNWTFGSDQEFNNWSHRAGTALHFAVTNNLSVFGGYRYSETHTSGFDTPYRSHGADLGADYNRAQTLRLTRRTTMNFGGGATAYTNRTGSQYYRLRADVDLQHEMGRTWSAQAAYSRGVDSDDIIFQDPMLYDRVSASISGLIGPRVNARVVVSKSWNAIGFVGADNRSASTTVAAGLQTAIGRYVAVSTDYTYYAYQFDSGVVFPRGLDNRSAGQAVRAYLSLWAPIFERGRRANASR